MSGEVRWVQIVIDTTSSKEIKLVRIVEANKKRSQYISGLRKFNVIFELRKNIIRKVFLEVTT